jgi:methylphosphotriester-DNA--protein-cysteine methyltransferase
MNRQQQRWQIPLEAMPHIGYIGENIHGRTSPVEHWHNKLFWGLHLYRYEAKLLVDGIEYPIRNGCVGLVPPNVHREYRFRGPSVHAYAHFTFPEAGRGHGLKIFIPVMQDLGAEFEPLYQALLEAAGWYTTEQLRANVRLWDILWQLADRPRTDRRHKPKLHPAVEHVTQLIEQNLAEPLTPRELARKVDLTATHLSRLFRIAYGMTLTGHIRARRVTRAKELLLHSALPVKAIAVAAGIPDLHLFNKTIRRELGMPPRTFRRRRGR